MHDIIHVALRPTTFVYKHSIGHTYTNTIFHVRYRPQIHEARPFYGGNKVRCRTSEVKADASEDGRAHLAARDSSWTFMIVEGLERQKRAVENLYGHAMRRGNQTGHHRMPLQPRSYCCLHSRRYALSYRLGYS